MKSRYGSSPEVAESKNSQQSFNVKPKEQKLFVYLTCIYIFSWYLQIGLRVDILGTIRFEFILGAILSVCAAIKLVNERKSTPLKGPVIFFFSVVAFYTAFSYDHAQSWNIFFNRVVKFSMLAAFIAAFVRTEWALKLIIGAFLLAMLKMGQEGFMGTLTGGMIWQNQGIPRLHGVTPLYRHPNSYSGMAVGCLPFIFYLYPVATRWQKAFLAVLFAFSIVIIVFTGSRTGYVATALLGLYFWREKLRIHKFKYTLIGLTVIILAYVALPEAYVGRIESIFTLDEAEGSSSDARIQIIKDALSVFFTKPWGVGVAAFPSVRIDMFGRFQDTHNLYLELLTNMSIFGLLAFFVFILKIIVVNKKIAENSNHSPFIRAMSKAIIGFIYARLFLGLFGMDTYEIYWWFALGLTIAIYRISEDTNNSNGSNRNSNFRLTAKRYIGKVPVGSTSQKFQLN